MTGVLDDNAETKQKQLGGGGCAYAPHNHGRLIAPQPIPDTLQPHQTSSRRDMDVSFTNVLEGARQYFQGLPVPSASEGSSGSADKSGPASSTSGPQENGSVSGSATTTTTTIASSVGDVAPSTSEGGTSGGSPSAFWAQSNVEPYPPQPTRVEVPDTRPGDDGSALEPSSSSPESVTLTEMQPSTRQLAPSSSSAEKQPAQIATSTSSTASSSSSSRSPLTTCPVYQHLIPVSRRPSFSGADVIPSSHPTSYSSGNERQSQASTPIVAQRTQYYPRYHHPDITKSAPAPFSQNPIYQSANGGPISSGNVQPPSTRPTPMEQSHQVIQGHCQQQDQRLASSYGVVPAVQCPASTAGSPAYSSASGHGHPAYHGQQINRIPTSGANNTQDGHSNDGSTGHPPSTPSPCNSQHGGSSGHIPSSPSQSYPAHIPSPHLPNPSGHHNHAQQQQQHTSRIGLPPHAINPNPYGSRVPIPHAATSSGSSSSQQMPPPLPTGYHPAVSPHERRHTTPSPHRQSPRVSGMQNPHASSPHHTSPHHPPSPHHTTSPHHTPSPHHAPSPHSGFQPHSPTYPPPPPARSNPHSYLPASSQHYQTSAGYPYHPPPQTSYHSFQKSPQPPQPPPQAQNAYYPQPSRLHTPTSYVAQQPMVGSNGPGYQPSKPVTYNGADVKRNAIDVPASYAAYRPPSAPLQRSSSTHNLPPIAALSSYHSNRRELVSKAQSMPRQRVHSGNTPPKIPPGSPATSSSVGIPQRIPEYPVTPPAAISHAIPVNGRTSSVANSSYGGRFAGQQANYTPYATTIAPSHHGGHSTNSTTVTSAGSTARSSQSTVHGYQSSEASRVGPSYHPQHQAPRHANEGYSYKDYPYQNSTTSQPSATAPLPTPTSQTNGVSIRKRESPLDLSVKTIRTSADSTAEDDEASMTEIAQESSSNFSPARNNGSRTVSSHSVQPAVPSATSYASLDTRNSTNGGRNPLPTQPVQTSALQTVCAPKVDFLPDFNSGPLRHHHSQPPENPLRRSSTSQQLYAPPQVNNTAPLPHMSTFKKSSLPTAPMYDGGVVSAPPLPTVSSYLPPGDVLAARTRYPPTGPIPTTTTTTTTTLPMQDYPSDPAKYYLESRSKFAQPPTSPSSRDRSISKRPAEITYPGPAKQPKLDTWRLAIDKQIQQKLSTARALHEQHKRQEMNLPVPLPNGTLVVPSSVYEHRSDSGYSSSESSRYQQAFCDKRNYQEPRTGPRSSPSYNHPVVSKPTNVHSLPQQVPGQSSYSGYRPRANCPPSSAIAGQASDQPSNTGADKRVLSLLRNSLENKQQREEQLNSQQPMLVNHSQQSFQNKVVAPVEPKSNIGRHNLSPFTAASLLERNSNTPPHYKFHVPRAVDSITQEVPRSLYGSRVNSSATLPGKEALLGPRAAAENQIHRDKDDGLAAMLAAKIRTKAELKQVGTGQFVAKPTGIPAQDPSATPKELDSAASTSTPQSCSSSGSPPKLTREKTACLPPRRRLFSRTEEDNMPVAATVPATTLAPALASSVPSRASGFRSSSETSVFDFRDSDSEGEMPVLERQTLEEMRRDRKQLSKVQPAVPLNDAMCMGTASSMDLVKIELKENDKINEVDPFWVTTCDEFMEQLRSGDSLKKRGRKKKVDGSGSRLDDDGNDSEKECESNQPTIKPEDIKKEVPEVEAEEKDKDDLPETSKEAENLKTIEPGKEVKTEHGIQSGRVEGHSSEDSDEVPLIKRAGKKNQKKEDSDCEDEPICRKRRIRRGSRIKLESSSGSESSSEESDASTEFGHGSSVADRLRARKRTINNSPENEGMKLRSRDTTPQKPKNEKESKPTTPKGSSSQKGKPKPLFGDGSDFRPGWEDEVYVYKKSLRMPPRLITVSKPSRFHRLSTSLPDLDPGSPALSVSMDSSDVCLSRKRLGDSDVESNYSFSIAGTGSKIDDEEATSSTTISCPSKTSTKHVKSENNSIVDLLAQKVGTGKKDQRKKQKEKLDKGGKILPKGSNEPELLPTPSLSPLVDSPTSKTKGKSPFKNNKSAKPIKVTDSFLLGYFRKETVNNYRDTFKNNHILPNEFSTFVLKSRTRTETRVMKKQATIREVFGEDRPASAPPMQTHGDTSQDDDSQNEAVENDLGQSTILKQRVVSHLRNAGILRSQKAIMNSKRHLLAKSRKDFLQTLAEKELKRLHPEAEEEVTNETQEGENNDLDYENSEPGGPIKKKLKLRTARRKFRSGFDYIRKKKKPLKKDETLSKERKRPQLVARPNPECVADIQSEIRTWVIKKGVGETILHRAARLGYTDVAAYCLEKLNTTPSPKDNAGYTPLHEACSRGHLEIAKLLLAYGANASESANGGIRPLHEAAENGATEIVRLLLSYGADPLLATYSGQTPLMLAADTEAYNILEKHLDDVQGRNSSMWFFSGPAAIFDSEEAGYNPLTDTPMDSPQAELDEVEIEVSDVNLPVLFSLANDPDKWVLLQDLMAALRIKSRDALLRQVNPKALAGPPAIAHRDVMKELKLPDFLEQSRCCHLLSAGERINVRASKVTLIKYNDKVKSLLNIERVVIGLR